MVVSFRRQILKLAALVVSGVLAQPVIADWVEPLPPLHELSGVTSVRVDLRGMPAALEGSQVTEASLRTSAVARLKRGGIKVVDDINASTLNISVLPIEYQSTYFVTIQVDLREPCSITRNPSPTGSTCVTWSTGPQVGIVNKGAESRLEQLLLAAVDRFVSMWQFDNPKGAKAEKTSNYVSGLLPQDGGGGERF